jgi:hypothetical protein
MHRVNPSSAASATLPGLAAYAAAAPHEKPRQAPPGYRGSALEERFLFEWRKAGGGPLAREYMFHPVRKWRADFAHIESRTLIEVEGGIWMKKGRHTTGAGFTEDCEKYLEAALHGWRCIRLVDSQLTSDIVARIVALTMF